MATIKRFEEIESWQTARELCKLIYQFSRKGEVQSQLYRSFDNEYIDEAEFKDAYEKADIVIRKNGKLIEYLNKTELRGVRYKK